MTRSVTAALVAVTLVSSCARLPPAGLPVGAGADIELTATPFFPQETHQCGPAALATMLGAAGVDVTPEQLVAQTYLPGRRGSLQLELIAAARTHRRIPYVIEPTLAALLAEVEAGHPVLVLEDLGVGPIRIWHYAVVVGFSHDPPQIVLRSGVVERRVVSAAAFERSWQKADRWGAVVLPPDRLPETADPTRYVDSVVPLETLGDDETALAAYAAALARWPDNPVALFGAANIAHRLGELESAQRNYRRLLELAPGNAIVLNNLAEVLLDRGCPDLALQYVDAANATGDLAVAIADTKAEAERLRAQRDDGPDCAL